MDVVDVVVVVVVDVVVAEEIQNLATYLPHAFVPPRAPNDILVSLFYFIFY